MYPGSAGTFTGVGSVASVSSQRATVCPGAPVAAASWAAARADGASAITSFQSLAQIVAAAARVVIFPAPPRPVRS